MSQPQEFLGVLAEDFLFLLLPEDAEGGEVYLATLRDGKAVESTLLMKSDTTASYTPAGGGRIYFVRIEEIDWIEAAGNYVHLHVGKEDHLLRESLTALEKKLDPSRFVRIHRSAIVNLDRVKEIVPQQSGDSVVVLLDGTRLRFSRWYRERFEARLER